jgi:hypothetical protein
MAIVGTASSASASATRTASNVATPLPSAYAQRSSGCSALQRSGSATALQAMAISSAA